MRPRGEDAITRDRQTVRLDRNLLVAPGCALLPQATVDLYKNPVIRIP